MSIHDDSDGNKEVPGAPGTCSEYDEELKGSVEDTPPIKINQKALVFSWPSWIDWGQ